MRNHDLYGLRAHVFYIELPFVAARYINQQKEGDYQERIKNKNQPGIMVSATWDRMVGVDPRQEIQVVAVRPLLKEPYPQEWQMLPTPTMTMFDRDRMPVEFHPSRTSSFDSSKRECFQSQIERIVGIARACIVGMAIYVTPTVIPWMRKRKPELLVQCWRAGLWWSAVHVGILSSLTIIGMIYMRNRASSAPQLEPSRTCSDSR